MIPSKILRLTISKNHKIKLGNYSWDKELQDKIFHITFMDGNKKLSLKTIFSNGYNIGNCLLTSYYVSSIIDNSQICTGKVEILKGTKNCPNGDHVWIETQENIIDTTLMIVLPKVSKYAKYYTKESSIFPLFSSEDLNYQDDIYMRENDIENFLLNLYKT